MLVRGARRLVLLAGPLLILVLLGVRLRYDHPAAIPSRLREWITPSSASMVDADAAAEKNVDADRDHQDPVRLDQNLTATHSQLFSASTADGKYFNISFAPSQGINPNIIPHPLLPDTWIVVALAYKTEEQSGAEFTELVCNAIFAHDVLQCTGPPTALPIQPTTGGICPERLSYFTLNVGPHDARVLYGPRVPYIVYGSNSGYTCFGQWIQDLRSVIPWGLTVGGGGPTDSQPFAAGTEIVRRPPFGAVEKNWFPFWDSDGNMYVHFDVTPHRSFARLEPGGTTGPDLASAVVEADDRCLASYLPKLPPDHESIHQATNSLSITTCKRSDPACTPDSSNTFLFTIVQHKTYYGYHSVYEPYVMVFAKQAPFGVHAVSRRPLWIHGRRRSATAGQSDMFYLTSISWKRRGQKYHGYMDDVLFLAFGIEDERSGGIDVVARHVLQGLGLCSDPDGES